MTGVQIPAVFNVMVIIEWLYFLLSSAEAKLIIKLITITPGYVRQSVCMCVC